MSDDVWKAAQTMIEEHGPLATFRAREAKERATDEARRQWWAEVQETIAQRCEGLAES